MAEEQRKKSFWYRIFWPIFIVIIGVWAIFPELWHRLIPSLMERRQLGDSYGVLNTLFSGFAFVGVIVAIFLQKEQLELQAREMTEMRKEAEAQKKEMKNQSLTQRRQQFESTFFNLLEYFKTLSSGIITTNSAENLSPSLERLRGHIEDADKKLSSSTRIQSIRHGFDLFYLEYDSMFRPYLGQLRNILLFVEKSQFQFEDRQFYASILFTQLSSAELVFLFYFRIWCDTDELRRLLAEGDFPRFVSAKMLFQESDMSLYTP